ncbi:MAG: phospholipid carrier-dependent glycosyltransferase [Chloroflexi bacterium]|nr:phospholipid carrier-dependent glycosyltransferase [Chloroflexota bacterium]
MANRSLFKVLLLIFVAVALRFYGLDWDGGIGAHPDERYIVGVAEGLHWPDRLNPFDVAPNFAYGHLPLYLLALTGKLVRGIDLFLVGRVLAALFDLGTVLLTYALGRQVYGENVGLLAAAFVAVTVLHMQQAHFYTADALLVFFTLGTLFSAVRMAEQGHSFDAWMTGVWAGLALGTKFSAALLMLPLGASLVSSPSTTRPDWWGRLKRGLECGVTAVVIFALTNPFALLEFSAFWRNVGTQSSIVRGVLDVPYTRQFHGTWAYVYPIVQQLRWGMGWPLGLVAFAGLAYAVWQAVREPPRRAEWVLLVWVVPGFAFIGALYAKFPRYLLPWTPLLALYAAYLFSILYQRNRNLSLAFVFLSFLYSLLCCLFFVNIYRVPHPWQVASEWFYDHVPRGAVVAVEGWDHPLPIDGTGYDVRELSVFDEDTPEKWTAMEETLAETDYVIIASRRGYATLARWPERYPLMTQYYHQLFDGELSFEPVACFGRYPRLGPLAGADNPAAGLDFALPELCQPDAAFVLRLGRLDESFVVYDHPRVVIFQRQP